MKKGDRITGRNGLTYTVEKSVGRGGQAKIWQVRDTASGKFYACKFYRHDPKNVRENIEDLIRIGAITDLNGNNLESVVMPITIINGTGNSFGYIMDLVDLNNYTTLIKAWCTPGKYPTPQAVCNIVKNFAHFFERLHIGYGLCYKDVNEGNIFFNPESGAIKIIDNDNIGTARKVTIKGTPYYMAPEVILGKAPDANSDKFSFAVFMYRLLVGGYPFEGPYTEKYCLKHDMLLNDPAASKELFGKNPVFVWHPTDKRNAIIHLTDPQHRGQAACWNRLPQAVKNLFIKTFVTNLPTARAAERTTDVAWRRTFEAVEKNLVTCPHCKKQTFPAADMCFVCRKPLPKATFKVLSRGEDARQISLHVGAQVYGDKISKNLPHEIIFKVLYKVRKKEFGLRNISRYDWTATEDNRNKITVAPNDIIPLKVGMRIAIIPKTTQLNVIALA